MDNFAGIYSRASSSLLDDHTVFWVIIFSFALALFIWKIWVEPKRFFRFATKDMPPRQVFPAVVGAAVELFTGPIYWLLNRLRGHFFHALAVAVGFILFVTSWTGIAAMFGWNPELPCCSDKRVSGLPLVWHILTTEWGIYFPIFSYAVIRIGQHIIDWRDWHMPWAHAEELRFAWRTRKPELDFPCLIIGRGGSGKSTLAQVMEHEFIRRKFFKPAGFHDVGTEDKLVARSGASIGGDVRRYQISWRPDVYKVGRLAEAYDMPGQITEDWVRAVEQVEDCHRVAIFNVVTFGCNNYIRKFGIADDPKPSPDQQALHDIELVKKGLIRLRGDRNANCECSTKANCTKEARKAVLGRPSNSPICASYLKTYQDHFRELEVEEFKQVAAALEKWNGKKPKLLVVHVVNMADCWIDLRDADWRKNAGNRVLPNKDDPIFQYYGSIDKNAAQKSFTRLNFEIKDAIGDVEIAVLPTSFEFGVTEHERFKSKKCGEEKLVVFDSTWEFDEKFINDEAGKQSKSPFDLKREWKVAKQALLGDMTVKTLRALRKELYRPADQFGTSKRSFGRFIDKHILWPGAPKEWAKIGHEYFCPHFGHKEKECPDRNAKKNTGLVSVRDGEIPDPQAEVINRNAPDLFDRWTDPKIRREHQQ